MRPGHSLVTFSRLPGEARRSIVPAMPFPATIYNVMVACPSDVDSAWAVATDVLARWNAMHSYEKKVVLLPMSWRTHSSPEIGDRPQAILNKQLVEKSDLLVAVFWTRIGTATGKAESGTVEEIREHIQDGKPVMIYFCEKPANLSDVDSEQYAKLKAFPSEVEGLYDVYKDDAELREKLERHLNDKVRDHPYFKRADLTPEGPRLQLSAALPLSQEAKALLDEAAKFKGEIVILNTLVGNVFQAGNKSFPAQEPRDRAKYDGAIDALVNSEFIKQDASNHNVFRVTDAGYRFIDATEQAAAGTDAANKASETQKNEGQIGATVFANSNVIRGWQSLVEIAKSDPRGAIKKSWEILAESIFQAANVAGVDADPNSQEISSSLKRLEGSVQFSASLIRSIREHQDLARKVFYQSNHAYDPSTLEAQNFVLGSEAMKNDLQREAK